MALKVAKPGAITIKKIRDSGAKNRTEYIRNQRSQSGSSSGSSRSSSGGSSGNRPVNEKESLKDKFGDNAPANIIIGSDGKKYYTSKAGQRFDSPEGAVNANLKINNPKSFNPNKQEFKSDRSVLIREASAGLTGTGSGQYATITSDGKVVGYSANKRINQKDIFLGDTYQDPNVISQRIKNIENEIDRQIRKQEQESNRQILRNTITNNSNKKTIESKTNVSQYQFDYDPVKKITDRALVKSFSARVNNPFKTGIPIIDYVGSNFAAGSAYVGELIAGAGGELGKRGTIRTYQQDIVNKEVVDRFFSNNKKGFRTYNPKAKPYNIYENGGISNGLQLEFYKKYSGGLKTKRMNVKDILNADKESFVLVNTDELKSSVNVGEQGGRLLGETIPYLTPAAFPKAIIDVGRSKTQEELITNVGTGVVLGGATKVIAKTGALIPLKLNKLFGGGKATLTKTGINYSSRIAKVTDKAVKATGKYGVPLASSGLLAVGGIESLKAAREGNKYKAQEIERQLFAGIGGIKLGGIAGDLVGNQLQRPIQKRIIFETGTQTLSGAKQKAFKEQFDYVYNVLPKKQTLVKEFKVNELEILKKLPKSSRAKVAKTTEKLLAKYQAQVIGSSTIVPQTKLKKTPKGKIGDVDVAKSSKALADELVLNLNKVLPKGYSAKAYTKDFQGTTKYPVSILKNGKRLADGKNLLEFVNVGTSLQPTSRQFDLFENIGITPSRTFVKTKSGVRLLDIKSQAKAKLYGGYFGGRSKDIVDLKGIIKGTKSLPVKKSGFNFSFPKIKISKPGLNIKSSFGILSSGKNVKIKSGEYYYSPVKSNNLFLSNYKAPKNDKKYYSANYEKTQPSVYTDYYMGKQSYSIPQNTSYTPTSNYDPKPSSYTPPKPNYDIPTKTDYVIKSDYKIPTNYKIPKTNYSVTGYPKIPTNYIPTKYSGSTSKKNLIPSDNIFNKVDNRGSKKQGYNVEVKRQGKFVLIAKDLPRNRAINFGVDEVDNTTARSFKIKKGRKTKLMDVPQTDLIKFRRPKGRTKLPTGTYVEKSTYNIDSVGEILGIPGKAKALRKQGYKKKKRK